jgi:two-component system CheB/CheR fusion protein
MRRYDGAYCWFLARAVPMRNEEGAIVKWFGTCTDISDQKATSDLLEKKVTERTQELQKINQELELSNNELMQFASVASHDLKEPLRKIHIFSNIIKDRHLKQLDSSVADYINRIIGSSSRMTRLINDLLLFSRLSVASLFEWTDLNAVVHEVLSDLELLIREKDALIESDTLPMMEVVPGQMRQVFQNLISNALKFSSKERQPRINVDCEQVERCIPEALHDPEGAFCRISIRDNGIGFDEQYSAKIFTIFQRLHSREQYEGTGIGLAITKKIIEKHGGIIYAKSKEGEGTTFTFIIPLHQHTHDKRVALAEPLKKPQTG